MITIKAGRVVTSPVTGMNYKVDHVLGEGGFGRAYLAYELNRKNKPVDEVCFKTTLDQTSWHRESYFGELLSRSKRVIQTIDSFPWQPNSNRKGMLFCLVMELAEHGTVADYLEKTGKAWTPARAKREISALLKVLDQLHGASATHRDLTPMNVFVCGNGTLKLGDFGIARHELAGKPMTVEAFNPAFVTQGFIDFKHRHWLAVDDVFQMGQLLGMLLRGDADTTVTTAMVNKLDCDSELKAIIKKAIGPRNKRFVDAYEMWQALQGDQGVTQSNLKTLNNKTVAFTGPLTMRRFDAELMVLQSGGTVAKSITKSVNVVVQGGRSQNYKNGHKGNKLLKAQQLIKQGQAIHIIGEAEFRRLVRDE